MPLLNPIGEEIQEECSNPKCKKKLPPKAQYMASFGGDFEIFCDECFAEIEILKLRTTCTEWPSLAQIYV